MTDEAELILRSRAHWGEVLRTMDPMTWALETARVELAKSGPLDFATHPFLIEPYRDVHSEIVFLKGAQLGFSTLAIVRALWAATTFPMSVIYSFPTSDDVSIYTAARINPIIASSEYLRSRILDADSVRVKQFSTSPVPPRQPGQRRRSVARLSTIYFNGAQTQKDATTVDADLLIHDEEDRSNPQVIQQYESRLDHSRFKWKIRLSTPTIPNHGIDAAYKASDMRVWLIRCPSCNHEFEMGFPANIQPDSIEEVEAGTPANFICDRCKHILSDADRAGGRWVASLTDPNLPHGYSVGQMVAPWMSAERILKRYADAEYEMDFWNLVMGRAWLGAASEFTRAMLMSRTDPMRPMASSGQGCTMGVDIGSMFDVVIGARSATGQPLTLFMDRVAGYEALDELMERFGVLSCVIDALPEEHSTRKWAVKYPKRVWRATYPSQQQEIKWDEETQKVALPRDLVLSASADELMLERLLPRFDSSPAFEAYIRHHENSKKVPQFAGTPRGEGDEGRSVQKYIWIANGHDHMFHAASYERIARLATPARRPLPTASIRGVRSEGGHRPLELTPHQGGMPTFGRRRR